MTNRLFTLALALAAFAAPGRGVDLIKEGVVFKYHKGTKDASSPRSAWTGIDFDDASWSRGKLPFYNNEDVEGGTELSDMKNGYSTVYIRRKFRVVDPSLFGAGTLQVKADDGYVAWLNGVEIASLHKPSSTLRYSSRSAKTNREPIKWHETKIHNLGGATEKGWNVLCVMLLNFSKGNSDAYLDVRLSSKEREFVPPEVVSVSPEPGELEKLDSITVKFSEPMSGIEAGDLMVNDYPALSVSAKGNAFTFKLDDLPPGKIDVWWSPTHGIGDQASPPNAFAPKNDPWTYELLDLVPPRLASHLPLEGTVRQFSQAEVWFDEPVQGVDARDLMANGVTAVSVTGIGAGPYLFYFKPILLGQVELTWADDADITDFNRTPNRFEGQAWTVQVDAEHTSGDVVISELSAASVKDYKRVDGDWIELHNRGEKEVNLEGWSLTDDRGDLAKWLFPKVTLDPDERLVVFATGEDDASNPTRLHTNFKLNPNGEFLALCSTESPRRTVSSVRFREQAPGNSFGLNADDEWVYFETPTPGSKNSTKTVSGRVKPVHFSLPRGFYERKAVYLTLSTETPGATIRYTTNGNTPACCGNGRYETVGKVYTGPIRISRTSIVRAVASKEGMLSSKVKTNTYFYGLSASRKRLPALSLVTDDRHLWGTKGIQKQPNAQRRGITWERPVSAELIRPEDNGGFAVDCGIRIQGGGYVRPRYNPTGQLPFSKYSFRLYFRGDYGTGRLEYPLFGDTPVQSFDRIVLRAGMNDHTSPFIKDEWSRRLGLNTGQVQSRGTFVNLFINGKYKGYYNPTERIDTKFLADWYQTDENYDVMAQFNEVRAGSSSSWRKLISNARRYDLTDPEDFQKLEQQVDMANFADYLLPLIWIANRDWPHNNWRAARHKSDGPFRFYAWDSEHAFQAGTSHNTINNELGSGNNADLAVLFNQLRKGPEFNLLFADRVHRHFYNDGGLTDAAIRETYDELYDTVRGTVSLNKNWGLNWIKNRRRNMMKHLKDANLAASDTAPTFNQFGGLVPGGFNLKLTATKGDIYYTTDGSDPRVRFANSVSGTSSKYDRAGGVTLTRGAQVKARTLNGGKWSALTSATFQVGDSAVPIRITEIMYNPQGGDAFEFVELQNVGDSELNLSGYSLDGISFRFAEGSPPLSPGTRLLLVNDANVEAFRSRYPGVRIGGLYEGSLSNRGERLALVDRNGETVLSVDYKDRGAWPSEADGDGYSLVLANADGDPDAPANWRASLAKGGTPGKPNADTPEPLVVINEVLAENVSTVKNGTRFPDYVELKNVAGTDVYLQNWSLSENPAKPRKFNIPAGVVIKADGYLTIWLDDDHEAPGLHAGFAMDNDGDTIALFNPAGERVDVITFGMQVADHSIGRSVNGWVLNQPTPGKANKNASVADLKKLRLNEFVAAAPAGGDDWVELYNMDSKPAALFGLTWEVGLGRFIYRRLSFIPAQGYQRFSADEQPGVRHLDFRLPAAGGTILLRDRNGAELDDVSYRTQEEGESRGRYPNGNGSWTTFTSTISPGKANYKPPTTGIRLNEILAINDAAVIDPIGRSSDWIEIENNSSRSYDLTGMSVSIDRMAAGQWTFPEGTRLRAKGRLVIWCNGTRDPALGPVDYLNTGWSLGGTHGSVYLFNAEEQVIDSIHYGFQVANTSIGRDKNGDWELLTSPTPGKANALSRLTATASNVVINEWSTGGRGDDWIELYNPNPLPVDLGGNHLTDDLSSIGRTKFEIPPLTFISPGGFVKWIADGDLSKGGDHLNFSLADLGEQVALYSRSKTLIEKVQTGQTEPGESEGRLPDGSSTIVAFTDTPTPGRSNYKPIESVVINEVLTHTDPPYEDAIELRNLGEEPLDIGKWWLSNSRSKLRKYQIPAGTTLPARGTTVFYEHQFNPAPGADHSFALNSAHGDKVILSAADSGGDLTGFRITVDFDAAENGISFGRIKTSQGDQFVTLSRPTFGVSQPVTLAAFRKGTGEANSGPSVGPVVLHEIMYHPAPLPHGAGTPDDEFIELRNITNRSVPLYDPLHPVNTWRIDGGVKYEFPVGTQLAAGEYALVVEFDPVKEPEQAKRLIKRYDIPEGTTLFGPMRGNLSNRGDTVRLYKPDPPQGPDREDAGFVPYILVDRVKFRDSAPWPSQADGRGATLQRKTGTAFGNDPVNWKADAPTPGRDNRRSEGEDSDGDGIPDEWEEANGLNPIVAADAAEDSDNDGLSNLAEYYAGTDPQNSASVFNLLAKRLANGNIELSFDATRDGQIVELQSTPALGQAGWEAIMEWASENAGLQQVEIDVSDSDAQFFRLLLIE